MNQTIHMHQVLHAFANRDGIQEAHLRVGVTDPRPANGRKEKRAHFLGARRVVTTVLMIFPLIVTELALGEVAPEGWIADVLDQTAQLLVLVQPF